MSDGTRESTISGAEIAACRKALGLTLAEMAALLGVRLNTLWRWEHGKAAPAHPGMLRLALEALAIRHEA